MSDAAEETDVPPRWRVIVDLILLIYTMFGRPADLAGRGIRALKHAAILRDMLCVIEFLIRRTLFLEALAAGAPARALSKSKRRTRTKAGVDGDDPALWRLSFAVLPAKARFTTGRAQHRPPATNTPIGAREDDRYLMPSWDLYEQVHGPRPGLTTIHYFIHRDRHKQRTAPTNANPFRALARRLEALARIVRKPAPRISALARRLFAAHGRDVADRILTMPPRSKFDPRGVYVEDIIPVCAAAHRAFLNSS